jgi:hypothetical protein
MKEDEHPGYKLYSLKFGQTCPAGDGYFLAWKSNLTDLLWKDHLESTKDMDIVDCVNRFRLRPPGHLIEDICSIWELPWQLVKKMIDDGRLNPFLDISFWFDSDGEMFLKPAGVYIHAEGINAFENANPALREHHAKHDYTKREREEYENQRRINEEIRKFSEEVENQKERAYELEYLNEQLLEENKRLKARETATPDCAHCKAEDNHVTEWIKDVECAVALTAQLFTTGERGCTAYHEVEWKTLRGGTRKRAFEAFRRTLPDHLKELDPKKK